MSPVSWSEPYLLVREPGGFPRGSHVTREHARQLSVINRVTLAEERWLPRPDADAAANYPTGCGHIQWLSGNRGGQLSHRLWTISAIALDKR